MGMPCTLWILSIGCSLRSAERSMNGSHRQAARHVRCDYQSSTIVVADMADICPKETAAYGMWCIR